MPVKKGKSITEKYYKDVVLKKLKKYYQKRRPATGFKHVRLLHDNAPAHTSAIVTAFLKKEKVSVLPHPPYSPDLAPCDFFLFPKLKVFLAGRKYQSRQALGSAVHQYLITVPSNSFRTSLVYRRDFVMVNKVDYSVITVCSDLSLVIFMVNMVLFITKIDSVNCSENSALPTTPLNLLK